MGSEESRSLLIQSHTRPLSLGGESDPEADQDAAGPAHETARQPRPPEHAAGQMLADGSRVRNRKIR